MLLTAVELSILTVCLEWEAVGGDRGSGGKTKSNLISAAENAVKAKTSDEQRAQTFHDATIFSLHLGGHMEQTFEEGGPRSGPLRSVPGMRHVERHAIFGICYCTTFRRLHVPLQWIPGSLTSHIASSRANDLDGRILSSPTDLSSRPVSC